MIVNLGRDLNLRPAPEPLLAAPEGLQWNAVWSTEDPRYGGCGLPMIDAVNGWRIPGDAAVVYRPGPPTRAREGGKPLEHIVRRRNLELVQKGVRRSKSDE